MSALFDVTRRDDGVASMRIATDADSYIGPAWVDGFAAALRGLTADEAVRVIVLEGAGRHFSAGASREALIDAAGGDARHAYAARAARILAGSVLPMVAAAAGHATGGGLMIALHCDAVVLAEESLYGATFMSLGFTPGMGATQVMGDAFGEPLGRELLLTGRTMTGREIRDACCPLSHAVHPRARVLEHALSLARTMADAPRESLVLLRRNLAARRSAGLEDALRAEADSHARIFADDRFVARLIERYPTTAAREGVADS